MANYIGTIPVAAMYIGATPIQRAYVGSTLVWSLTQIRDDFNRDDIADLSAETSPRWADAGPSVDYFAGIVDGACRMSIPDSIAGLNLRTSRKRFSTATAASNNGYTECRVRNKGDSNSTHFTQVHGRVSNSGYTHGVGIDLRGSALSICRRVSSADTLMANCGAFADGDVLRLVHNGNVHTMYRNGVFVGEWDDTTGTAAQGASYRSLGLVVNGSKDFLGTRRFSPSLDYVEYG